jgi:hypothetical protein
MLHAVITLARFETPVFALNFAIRLGSRVAPCILGARQPGEGGSSAG